MNVECQLRSRCGHGLGLASYMFKKRELCISPLFLSISMLVMAACLPCSGFPASILRVNASAIGINNGTSWADAYVDLQAALAVAKAGDEIWVAAGTYKPTNGIDRGKSFVLVAGTRLYSGFAGTTETTHSQRDGKAHETILSGDIGVQGEISDNS